MTLTLVDFFCGAGGSSQGAVAVPGVTARLAANHWPARAAARKRQKKKEAEEIEEVKDSRAT